MNKLIYLLSRPLRLSRKGAKSFNRTALFVALRRCERNIPLRSACIILTVPLCLFLLSGCGNAPEPLPVPDNPKRVVSLAPSITECLFAIGAGERVVGVTSFCNYPEEAKTRQKIGGYTDANYELIYSMKPDVVFLLDEHSAAAERLREIGIPHVRLDTATIPSIFKTIETLGHILHQEEGSEKIRADLNGRIETVKSKIAGAPKRRVLISIGRNMGSGGLSDVYVAGKNTHYDEMLEMIGAENVYSGSLDYARMSHEAIMQLAPDVIIDLIPDLKTSVKMTPEEVKKEWDVLKNVPAVKNGQVCVLGDSYVCIPGPRFVLVFEDIARAVYPEVFEVAE